MKNQDSQFEDHVRQVLNNSLADLDSETARKLSYLKYRAVNGAERKKQRNRLWVVAPAVVTLLIIVLLNVPLGSRPQPVPLDSAELTILTDTTPLEFYAQDVEFYLWLSENMDKDGDLRDFGLVLPGHETIAALGSAGRAG